jgi:hypothetical protein
MCPAAIIEICCSVTAVTSISKRLAGRKGLRPWNLRVSGPRIECPAASR